MLQGRVADCQRQLFAGQNLSKAKTAVSVLTRCCRATWPTVKNRRLRCTADTESEGRRGEPSPESAGPPPAATHAVC